HHSFNIGDNSFQLSNLPIQLFPHSIFLSTAMRMLAISACLLTTVASQAILFDSFFCQSFGPKLKTSAVKTKYQTMVGNLNKDTTLKAQKTRVSNFIKNNWNALKSDFNDGVTAASMTTATLSRLAARWRIVTALKGLMAKIKPKLATTKFDEIRKLLWSMDKTAKQNVYYAYSDWKGKAIAAITASAKKTEITNAINNYEASTAFATFTDDQMWWMTPPGYKGCF
ncbi:hypothetical protein PENTCL1PPCAC_1359, partial [Pristionchus entomophagus]